MPLEQSACWEMEHVHEQAPAPRVGAPNTMRSAKPAGQESVAVL
jgi:hypothetical protein